MPTITAIPGAATLGRVIGTRSAPGGAYQPLDPPAQLEVGDVAWVPAFGRLRRGLVIKVARTRVRVAWVAPSNPEVVRTTNERAAYVYPDRRASESGAA